jgi:hypothetical protein
VGDTARRAAREWIDGARELLLDVNTNYTLNLTYLFSLILLI